MVSTKRFTWDKKNKTLVAEMSDFGPSIWEQAYPDACDLGIKVLSHYTGQEIMFVTTREIKDREGELRFTELEPTKESLQKCPKANGIKMVLFND